MPQAFNRREIKSITDDLKLFLSAANGPIGKLDYFNTRAASVEKNELIEIDYHYQHTDLIPEVENAVISQVEKAEARSINLQLHLSPASLMVQVDRLFFQQIFFRLFADMLQVNEKNAIISVYVTDSDGKCVIELMSRPEAQAAQASEDYFKKYRITNVLQAPQKLDEDLLPVYKKMVEDMGGELSYVFAKDKPNYVRLKFAIS
jgi:K+-sensing histidine kinase KdpD